MIEAEEGSSPTASETGAYARLRHSGRPSRNGRARQISTFPEHDDDDGDGDDVRKNNNTNTLNTNTNTNTNTTVRRAEAKAVKALNDRDNNNDNNNNNNNNNERDGERVGVVQEDLNKNNINRRRSENERHNFRLLSTFLKAVLFKNDNNKNNKNNNYIENNDNDKFVLLPSLMTKRTPHDIASYYGITNFDSRSIVIEYFQAKRNTLQRWWRDKYAHNNNNNNSNYHHQQHKQHQRRRNSSPNSIPKPIMNSRDGKITFVKRKDFNKINGGHDHVYLNSSSSVNSVVHLDPKLLRFVLYFTLVLFMETKIAIVGVKEMAPNRINRRMVSPLTPESSSIYVRNMLCRFLPMQFSIDCCFLLFCLRKRSNALGIYEYAVEVEEKAYFVRHLIKTFMRHPQVTMALAGFYGPISHEFSSTQLATLLLMPLCIGKYRISKYSTWKISLMYAISNITFVYLFQFSAPEVKNMWFGENKADYFSYLDIMLVMFRRCSLQYMCFIFLMPLIFHGQYVFQNYYYKKGVKKFVNLTLAAKMPAALKKKETINNFISSKKTTKKARSIFGYNVTNKFLEVLGFGIYLRSRSKKLRNSPQSSQYDSEEKSDSQASLRGDDGNERESVSILDLPKESLDILGELCGRSVADECSVMDGTHVVLYSPLQTHSKEIIAPLFEREFLQVVKAVKELHSKSVTVSSASDVDELSVRVDGKGDAMSCSVWQGFVPENISIRKFTEQIEPKKCAIGVGRSKEVAYTSNTGYNTVIKVKMQSRYPQSSSKIISVSPMCVLPGVETRIQIVGRKLSNTTLCARLHGKPDIEEVFILGRAAGENQKQNSNNTSNFSREHGFRNSNYSFYSDDNVSSDNVSDSSDDEQLEQAPLESVFVDVCVDPNYDGGLFFLQFLNAPFSSSAIPIIVTPFVDIKRELDQQLASRKLGEGARVALFKCAEITGGRGMDWNTDAFAEIAERDLKLEKFSELVRFAKVP